MKKCKNCHYYRVEKNKCIKLNKKVLEELCCKNFIDINSTKKTWYQKPRLKKHEKIVVVKHYFIY